MTTYSAVATTGIYCRPGCSAKPLAENVRTFELAAAAEAAGFRACLRCRPYRVAGPVTANAPELVCRGVQLIIEGTLDDGGREADLAARLDVSPRHLRRLFDRHLGVTPDQLARSRRAHFARRLLDDSDLNIADIAFASGFGSLRQFNRDMREVFRAAPRELRDRRHRADRLAADGGLTMRLSFQAPFDWEGVAAFLGERAVPGVESLQDGVYRRTISLDGGPGMVEVGPGGDGYLRLRLHLPYWEGLIHIVERVARMVGADTEVDSAVADLGADPVLGALVAKRPGLRVPGAWGPFEVAVHAVLAQHCGLAEAQVSMGALARKFGPAVPGLEHGLGWLFPAADVLAMADLAAVNLPCGAGPAVTALAAAVAGKELVLDGGVDLARLLTSLTAVPGIEKGTAEQVALRLGHRDVFPSSDPGVRSALRVLNRSEPDEQGTARWRPWRALAAAHLLTYAADVI